LVINGIFIIYSSWFSGLRSRLSQLVMPEWLNQLGIVSGFQQNSNRDSLQSSPKPSSNEKSQNLNTDLWNTSENYEDSLTVQHFGPLKNLINYCSQPGKGHKFQLMFAAQPTWCDKCGDFMWGFLTHAVKCETCNYTCHSRCSSLVTLDCKTAESSGKSTESLCATLSSINKTTPIYPDLSFLSSLDESSQEELDFCNECPLKEQEAEKAFDHFSGSVQIHMNFTRPINIVADQSGFSLVDNNNENSSMKSVKTITTFFLPRNTIKNVNISSKMTTREIVVTLLRKFKVADNPRKFALYERVFADSIDQTIRKCELIRINDDAYPLRMVNEWRQSGLVRQLVLQENDTGDILWDMFEIPELENFLVILADEEKQYLFRIRQKYDVYRYYLNQALRNHGCTTGIGDESGCFPETTNHIYENVSFEYQY
uniref:Ras association domain-containing protein 1 n=1 Tax=Dracunculus medinensis TaxID=318479 RepID=A0A0N4U725_DRAME